MDSLDSEHARKCQIGDSEAFGMLYDRYIKRIYRFVYFKTFDTSIAEDIVSGVFLKAYERIGSFDPKRGAFSQWIYSIARNAVIDHYRIARKNINIEDVFDLGEDERTEEKLDARDLLSKVERYLSKVDSRQREIVTLRIWEELSYKEIANIVGGSESSVKMAFSRTIRELRKKLGPGALLALLLLAHQSVT